MNSESHQNRILARNHMGMSDLSLRCWETIAILALAFGSNAAVAVADPAQLGPATAECLYGTPIYEQDNRAGGHVTRHVTAYRLTGSDAAFYESGLAIDADGAPNAYHPSGSPPALDSLSAAGYPKSCNVLVCLGRNATGSHRYAKASGGPFDGFYVSMTSLMNEQTDREGHPLHGKADFARYVDSTVVPYIAVASRAMRPFRLQRGTHSTNAPGEVAYVVNLRNGQTSPAIFADVGTNDTLGEGSVALAKSLGLSERQQSPTHGGLQSGILTIIFPDSESTPPWPRDTSDIATAANERFKAWGGLERVKHCFPNAAIP
ncbi:MAG: glycoside hydrolase family 75 protein [Methylocella sp.]